MVVPCISFNLLAKGVNLVQGVQGKVVMNINNKLQAMGLHIV